MIKKRFFKNASKNLYPTISLNVSTNSAVNFLQLALSNKLGDFIQQSYRF